LMSATTTSSAVTRSPTSCSRFAENLMVPSVVGQVFAEIQQGAIKRTLHLFCPTLGRPASECAMGICMRQDSKRVKRSNSGGTFDKAPAVRGTRRATVPSDQHRAILEEPVCCINRSKVAPPKRIIASVPTPARKCHAQFWGSRSSFS